MSITARAAIRVIQLGASSALRLVLSVCLLTCCPLSSWAQTQTGSLGEIARRLRAARTKKGPSEVPLYTNDKLSGSSISSSATERPAAPLVEGARVEGQAPAAGNGKDEDPSEIPFYASDNRSVIEARPVPPAEGTQAEVQVAAGGQEGTKECEEPCWREKQSENESSRTQYDQDANTAVGEQDFNTAAGMRQSDLQSSFVVKYVIQDAVYLEGGKNVGLAVGMRLTVKRPAPAGEEISLQVVAEIEVAALGSASAVCEVRSATGAIRVGDVAYLSVEDLQNLQLQQGTAGSRKYPQVVSFTEGDPLDEEMRDYIPRPPSPEVNRVRGRIGFEYNTIRSRGSPTSHSAQAGLVLRVDMSRLGGTYWNFSGYWRGRLNSRSSEPQQETLTDLINRTYHLSLNYQNPNSRWVAGLGRLYLPWASSLSTIDGGYVGRRLEKTVTVGLFAGSTPDPTAWNYNPDRHIAGSFVNFEGGSFDSFHYTSTLGAAVTQIRWKPERQFAFFENGFFYKRFFSLYHSLEADVRETGSQSAGTGSGVSRSYLTVRVQPHPILSFDISHNYFRDLPTFDPRLVGTGLVDKLLFQGLSGGLRLELPYRISLYSSLGRSHRTGDTQSSWNQLYGITVGQIWRTGIRADLRFSQFDSSFGRGSYRSLSLTRELGETLRLEVQAGEQNFSSPLTEQTLARWIIASFDWFFSTHYFLGSGFTVYRGDVQNYDQLFLNLGYRF